MLKNKRISESGTILTRLEERYILGDKYNELLQWYKGKFKIEQSILNEERSK